MGDLVTKNTNLTELSEWICNKPGIMNLKLIKTKVYLYVEGHLHEILDLTLINIISKMAVIMSFDWDLTIFFVLI